MATAGPNNPGTQASDTTLGGLSWTNPSDAATSNDAWATALLTASGGATPFSQYLKLTGFGFSIPAGATIDGITVSVERNKTGFGTIVDNRVRIVKGGTIGSTDKASATAWPATTDSSASYGSSSDLWGDTWASTDINDSGFGIAISAKNTHATQSGTARIDTATITVNYTVAATGYAHSQVVTC